MIYSSVLFILAGLFEIGGGYLIWLWLRDGKPFYWGVFGGLALERPLVTLRGDGKSYIYSNFSPKYAQFAITIL